MKVILLENIDKIGKKNDIKEVSEGFARNFLLPKNLAIVADKINLDRIELMKKKEVELLEKKKEEFRNKAKSLKGKEVKIEVAVGEEGQLFESINKQKIAEKLEINKDFVELNEPIKEVGRFPVKLNFGDDIESEVIIVVKKQAK